MMNFSIDQGANLWDAVTQGARGFLYDEKRMIEKRGKDKS